MLFCWICHEITEMCGLIVINREDPQISWLSSYYNRNTAL